MERMTIYNYGSLGSISTNDAKTALPILTLFQFELSNRKRLFLRTLMIKYIIYHTGFFFP